jgi:hypothetical protein
MEIVNASDMDVTWWCYTHVETPLAGVAQEGGTLPGGKGDLPPGGRASFTPPGGIVWVDVIFTKTDGERTYAPWTPSNASTLASLYRVNWGAKVTFRRGSGKWEAVYAAGSGTQV